MNAISVENLSKYYKIYSSPAGKLADLALPWREFHKKLWALRDVSFDVPAGQALGIIGRNGSGKTTLLKVLMGISRQSSGVVDIKGRVTALLELGAGFHPEFTGRENVFMNCAMMGMSRKEAEHKLDEIIDFSELGDFIDMPVKMYSSGMYVRLGFSVATSVEPDILIVDEALSVGDQDFVSKCRERFRKLLDRNATLLFVSHDLGLVRMLADRVILLSGGENIADGEPDEIANLYLERIHQADTARLACQSSAATDRRDDVKIRIDGVNLYNDAGEEQHVYKPLEPIDIRVRYSVRERVASPSFSVEICRNDGTVLLNSFPGMAEIAANFGSNNPVRDIARAIPDKNPGDSGEVSIRFDRLPLVSGEYFLNVRVFEITNIWTVVDEMYRARSLKIRDLGVFVPGMMYVPFDWKDTQDG